MSTAMMTLPLIINCVLADAYYQIRYRIACLALKGGSRIEFLTKPGTILLEDKGIN